MSFNEAKKQCLREILSIFSISSIDETNSELFDISKIGNSNACLLAISSIIQANRTIPDLTTKLVRLQQDLKEDGELDTEFLKSDLITSAVLCDYEAITRNLKEWYTNLNQDFIIPDIKPFIDTFISNSSFEKLIEIEIPEYTELGSNILCLGDTILIDKNLDYCMSVNQVLCNAYLDTYLRFEPFESIPAPTRNDLEITNIQNWGIPDNYFEDPYALSYWPFDFHMRSCTGYSNLQFSFNNQGKFVVIVDLLSEYYGYIRKVKVLQWE